MRGLIALPLLLAACSGGDDQQSSPIEAVVEEAGIEGGAVQSEIERQAKSIEEAADKAAALIEAEARQESREVRPESGEANDPE